MLEERERKEFILYCDDCGNYLGEGPSLEHAYHEAAQNHTTRWRLWNGLEYVYRTLCETCSKQFDNEARHWTRCGVR